MQQHNTELFFRVPQKNTALPQANKPTAYLVPLTLEPPPDCKAAV